MTLSRSEALAGARSRQAVASRPRVGPVVAGAAPGAFGDPLSGLAAVAVAAVVLGHAGSDRLPGGGLGVDVLLVLAGFVVTVALMDEFDRTGRVALAGFYGRVLRLLGPALAVVLVVVSAVSLVAGGDATTGALKGEAVAALGGVSNWYAALIDMPVGLAPEEGAWSLLQHLWAVALIAQVVLVWPVLVVGCAPPKKNSLGGWAWLRRVSLTLAVVSAALMVVLAAVSDVPGSDVTARVAFGTDTRLTAVMLGAALATVRNTNGAPARGQAPVQAGARRAWDTIGMLAAAGLIAVMVAVGEFSVGAFRGGSVVVALLAVVLLAAATVPSSRIGAVARIPAFGWLGARAYALYLWHWPVVVWSGDLPFGGTPAFALRVTAVVVLADLTYRWVERPIRGGAVGRMLERMQSEDGARAAMLRRRLVLTTSTGAVLVAMVVAGMVTTPSAAVTESAAADDDTAVPEPEPPPVDCAVDRCVALTFDDGPGPHTERLLGILDELDVTATFFMLGEQVERFPAVARRVRDAGHEIGAHTYDHADLLTLEPADAAEQIRAGVEAISTATGTTPTLFRPPYGSTDEAVLGLVAAQGLAEIHWDVDTLDWKYRIPDAIVDRALGGVAPGSIVLMHDIRSSTVDAVRDLVGGLRAAGYTLVPAGRLLDGMLEPGASFSSRPAATPTPGQPESGQPSPDVSSSP